MKDYRIQLFNIFSERKSNAKLIIFVGPSKAIKAKLILWMETVAVKWKLSEYLSGIK